MRNLVTGVVVEIEEMFPVCGPGIPFNRIAGLVRNAMRILGIECTHPNIQRITLIGREPAQL